MIVRLRCVKGSKKQKHDLRRNTKMNRNLKEMTDNNLVCLPMSQVHLDL